MRPPFPLLPGAYAHTLPDTEIGEVHFLGTPPGVLDAYHDEAVEQMMVMFSEPTEEQLQRRQRLLAKMVAHSDQPVYCADRRGPTEEARLLEEAFVQVKRMRGRMIGVSWGCKS